jgi:hypothetical protein
MGDIVSHTLDILQRAMLTPDYPILSHLCCCEADHHTKR